MTRGRSAPRGRSLLSSVAAHGLLVLMLLAQSHHPDAAQPTEVAASVEVVFGKNADAPGPAPNPAPNPAPADISTPAVAQAEPVPSLPVPSLTTGRPADLTDARTEAALDTVPMPPPPSATLAQLVLAKQPDVRTTDGGEVGLDFRRGEEGVVEAASDPGNKAPRYPEAAVARRESGLVVWRMFIDSDGRVDHIEPVHSSSFHDLDDAARVAFLRWHYRPATRDGVAVASMRDLTANFVLTAP